jgi:hypothetical protein
MEIPSRKSSLKYVRHPEQSHAHVVVPNEGAPVTADFSGEYPRLRASTINPTFKSPLKQSKNRHIQLILYTSLLVISSVAVILLISAQKKFAGHFKLRPKDKKHCRTNYLITALLSAFTSLGYISYNYIFKRNVSKEPPKFTISTSIVWITVIEILWTFTLLILWIFNIFNMVFSKDGCSGESHRRLKLGFPVHGLCEMFTAFSIIGATAAIISFIILTCRINEARKLESFSRFMRN